MLYKVLTVSAIAAMLFSAGCTKANGSISIPTNTPPAITQTYTPSPTNTPFPSDTPTYTPSPTTPVPLEGRLFFDMNGSGLQDEATFNYNPAYGYDPARLTDERQPLQADLLKVITNYMAAHPELKKGDFITIEEPGLSGYTVCVESTCDKTDAEGKFVIADPGASSSPKLTITDPNAGVPALEMGYINKWNGPVVIPAYEINGVQVPEQHLNDTEVIPIARGITVKAGQLNEIGLMQGFLTLPFSNETWKKVTRIVGYDHDPRINMILRYDGNTLRCTPFGVGCFGPDDGHIGTDYGLPSSSVIFASLPGDLETWINQNGAGSRNLRIKNNLNIGGGNNFETDCDHLSVYIIPASVSDWNTQNFGHFYRGQILALSGHTGTEWDHVHTDMHFGTDLPIREDAYLAGLRREKDPYGVLEPVPVTFDYERNSLWSVFNLPIFPFDVEHK